MSTYHTILVNFTADVRSVAGKPEHMESRELTDAEVRQLLEAFCGIDPVENEALEPEIRIQVRHDNYLLRTGQKKLIFYDARHRDLPALVLTVEETMKELDGSAEAARSASTLRHALRTGAATAAPFPAARAPETKASRPRLLAFGAITLALLTALVALRWGNRPAALPAQYRPVGDAEAVSLRAGLVGVYMTGNEPGDHGIVVSLAGELKLFELNALTPPRVVYAAVEAGRIGSQPALATDQPGGVITVVDRDTLSYCGETYRRIP
ncbi:MAG: hypothetical protein HYV95_15045 [Opitutae bacterium]|nr:hypothetical protein [Opitutae bacterium]